MVIRVEGHICCGPADEIDGIDLETGLENLSISRSMAVQQFLINKGIEAQRISHAGFGHSRPIYPYPEKNKEEEQANRRVEIVITAL
jgi:outer membrane protein OmpA-like peptidoglycan-associated protein